MICVVQFMETLYVNVPCCDPDTAAHNHYYFFQAYDVLLGHSGIFFINGAPRWKKIYRVSDNGTPFMNRYSCLTESFMQEKYNISIVVLPLCQYHAWSLCDSHGGVVKAKMKRAEIRGEIPEEAGEVKKMLEEELQRTFVFPQEKISVVNIDREIYARFGGFNRVGPVPGLGDVGHIMYLKFGVVLTRKRPNCSDTVELRVQLPKDLRPPTWHYHNQLTYELAKYCKQCSVIYMRPVLSHVCLLKAKHQTKAGKKRLKTILEGAISVSEGDDDPEEVVESDGEVVLVPETQPSVLQVPET